MEKKSYYASEQEDAEIYFGGPYSSTEEALDEYGRDYQEIETLHVGEAVPYAGMWGSFDSLLELEHDNVAGELGECCDFAFDAVTREAEKDLICLLKKTALEWSEKNKLRFKDMCSIENVKEYPNPHYKEGVEHV